MVECNKQYLEYLTLDELRLLGTNFSVYSYSNKCITIYKNEILNKKIFDEYEDAYDYSISLKNKKIPSSIHLLDKDNDELFMITNHKNISKAYALKNPS